jgi:hypothetical protein
VPACTTFLPARFPGVRVLGPFSLLAGLCAAAILAGAEGASAERARVIGNTEKTPKLVCPESTSRHPCEVMSRVTGFQTQADGKENLFRIPRDGHIVAWSVDLSKPDKSQRRFFEDLPNVNGRGPRARIGVLKRIEGTKYKLKSQSPVVDLTSFFRERPIFTLNDPLRVGKGDVLALTTPTWIPNFSNRVSRDDAWRASRSPEKCNVNLDTRQGKESFKDSKPHDDVDDVRRYGCHYTGARLLYWGYLAAG